MEKAFVMDVVTESAAQLPARSRQSNEELAERVK